ncbi:MAG: hypothetical protein Q9M26_06665 [Mariprofundales bacterium]|nr:hypothetical protein [Mariprofundales bacterium]
MMKKIMGSTMLMLSILLLPCSAIAASLGTVVVDSAITALGKTASRSISKRSMRLLEGIEQRGGKSLVARAEQLGLSHGEKAIKVLAKDPKVLIPAIERFRFADQSRLLAFLARSPGLSKAVNRYGADVLKLELRSKGQAMRIIDTFGDGGLKLTAQLNDKQLMLLTQESSRFKGVSAKTVKEFLDMAGKYTGKVFNWLEKHPRLLYTGTGAILVMQMKTELLGDPATGTQGAVQQVADSVMAGVTAIGKEFAPWIAGALALWLSFRSWLRRPQPQQPPQRRGFWSFKRKQDDVIDAVVS